MARRRRDALLEVLDQFGHVRSVIETAIRSLDSREPECDEVITLRVAVRMLRNAYNTLDAAAIGATRTSD